MSHQKNIVVAPVTTQARMKRRFVLLSILGVALTTPALVVLNWDHKLVFISLELVTKFFIVYPAIRPNCRWFGPVATNFLARKKAVWLTIDDGPHPEDTPQLLALLKQFNARATFFVIGWRVQKYPELARAILRDGHTLANHTQTHPVLTFWSFFTARLTREIEQCNQALIAATGQSPRWFRAPVGMANVWLHFLLRDRGMKLIGWSARGFDGLYHDTEAMAGLIQKTTQSGTIILLHEGRRDRQGRPINLILAETVLTRLAADGYIFIVPDEKDFV